MHTIQTQSSEIKWYLWIVTFKFSHFKETRSKFGYVSVSSGEVVNLSGEEAVLRDGFKQFVKDLVLT